MRHDLDPEKIKELAEIMCTYDEIAKVMKCNRKTLMRRFSKIIEEGWSVGQSCLRRQQMKLAMDGNATMLVWLGKQCLGQSDQIENTNNIVIVREKTVDTSPKNLSLSGGSEIETGPIGIAQG